MTRCPCGNADYDTCCGRLHQGRDLAATAEELMRSRYSAYAMGELNYLFRTWHPRTRPADVAATPGVTWRGLDIIDTVDGGPGAEEGIVEFIARFETDAGKDVLHERSRFAWRANRWMYLDGDIADG